MANSTETDIELVDQLLPQTQCEQCEYEGCYAYASAIITENAPINRCPPGGKAVIRALSQLLNQPEIPLDTTLGEYIPPQVVRIEEDYCIGCMKCILACPVDAIVGARRLMHTVIRDECTGCALCIPPCPLNCIVIEPLNVTIPADQIGLTEFEQQRAEQSRRRFNAKKAREAARNSITDTQPPQEKKLAEPVSKNKMLDLIQMARKEFKKKGS
ncbi:electron transporter RnfB [Ignatzschineria ureiclastica]|uniref:Electron transporter RnfB n=1 Tax=Ignatzschineria ureiclastica TaxID=472582 RepID=A0A2U2AGV3_9GAMM|nr:RnfABCDGE type electron transport complex subunit B [Ignatzschineria ureiclastica]PWD81885.1 electron transporter RnfB [Ignatzschineria ureiclastica]GGZ91214.1 4Fe-4S ferredoxin [Ignatzschineria ureiclastica]